MSTTFVLTLIVSVLVVAYWRVAVVILLAALLALLLTGVNTVAQALDGQLEQPEQPVVVAPAQPGPPPNDLGNQSDNDPPAQSAPQN